MIVNHVCLVCLGSNAESEMHLDNARKALLKAFQEVEFGDLIVTAAEGRFQQPDYSNQAARFATTLSTDDVLRLLKQIELDNGRTPTDKLRGCVPLDIDLLVYDDQIIKPADLCKAYVQQAIQSVPQR